MSILIKGMEIPKSCYECKLDLRSDVCSAFCEWNAEHPYSIRATDRLPGCPLSEVPECEDAVPRTSNERKMEMRLIDGEELLARYKARCNGCKETKNYCEHCCDIADIINDIEDAPTIEERKKGKWEYPPTNGVRPFGFDTVYCTECGFFTVWDNNYNYCPNCGADMRGDGNDN